MGPPATVPAGLTSEMVADGGVKRRLAADDADLVVWYTGEQDGRLVPCGCDTAPLGGVARLGGYLGAAKGAGQPGISVNTGNWLTSALGPDGETLAPASRDADALMLRAAHLWDALNVGYRDLPYLAEAGFPRSAVSANVAAREGDGPAPYVIVERGGLRVAVTGVTSWGMARIQPERFAWTDPADALAALIPGIDADLVVVLGYELGRDATRVARVPGVDLLVEAGQFEHFDPATRERDAVWVRSWKEGQHLGELRAKVEGGRIRDAVDRSIPLDPAIKADRELERLERAAGAEPR